MSIDFHRSLPGGAVPAARMPVLADQVVATSQPLASQVGLHMLERGGTAADAAVAMAAALTVIEPTSNGIGGDAFCMVWDGTQIHGINASGRSPAALNIERLRDQGIPRTGWDAVTVPGCVSGWVSLWKQFGRLPFSTLLEPAIHLAEDGFPVAPQCAEAWRRAAQRYSPFSEWMRTFTMDVAPLRLVPGGICLIMPRRSKTLLPLKVIRSIRETWQRRWRKPQAVQVAPLIFRIWLNIRP